MPIPEPGDFGLEALPPPRANEVELMTDALDTYQVGESVCSEQRDLEDFSFRLVVYPQGFSAQNRSVAAFVEAQEPGTEEEEWSKAVRFQVTLMNCIDYRVSIGRIDEGALSPHETGADGFT
ncbi:Ubiquitin carboxyl-terminal hydrolase 13 [Durusdinium trenchii]|uniref:Ubiquitin carboxyl-terminal hydrolase 13 n=1 Tax=Durusdinium trenchii TaxID=1381693 RepID=A0ABP0SK16_9DINO